MDKRSDSAFCSTQWWHQKLKDRDPFAQNVRDERTAGTRRNVFLILILCPGLLIYSAYLFYEHVNRPTAESFSLMPMSAIPLQEIVVRMECSELWGCYKGVVDANHTNMVWDAGGAVTVSQQYTPTKVGAGCLAATNRVATVNTGLPAGTKNSESKLWFDTAEATQGGGRRDHHVLPSTVWPKLPNLELCYSSSWLCSLA